MLLSTGQYGWIGVSVFRRTQVFSFHRCIVVSKKMTTTPSGKAASENCCDLDGIGTFCPSDVCSRFNLVLNLFLTWWLFGIDKLN